MSFLNFVISELIHSRRFVFLFVLNLSFGLSSFIALELLKTSIDRTVSTQSKNVLGADLSITSRRRLTANEIEIAESSLPKERQSTNTVETFSMVSKASVSSLVQIKAVEMDFPFYGQVLTRPMTKTSYLEDTQTIWVYPEILTLLNAAIGDSLKIGDLSFRIAAIVVDDAASGISTNMAPRIYMSLSNLKKTNLLRPGTLAWYSKLYKLPLWNDRTLETERDKIFSLLPASDIQVFTHKNSSEQSGRLLGYLADFLGLVSLAALFISCIGITFLLSHFLQKKSKSIAILIAIGFPRSRALLFYFIQLIIIVVFGALAAVAVAALTLPLILQATQTVAQFSIKLSIDVKTLSMSLGLGIFGGLLLLIPEILRLRTTNANQLLRSGPVLSSKTDLWVYFAYLPAILLFYYLSVRQMHSYRNGGLFFACFMGAGILLYATAYFLLPLLNRLPSSRWYPFAWAIRDLSRLRMATITGFLSLSLGIFLVNLVPQIKANLQAEIARPPESKIPSLFLFDIQEEQVAEIKALLIEHNIPLNNLSPLIRARLVAVNSEPFHKGSGAFSAKKTREEETESQFRNRGFNLSYREQFDSSETLVSGKALPRSQVSSHLNTIGTPNLNSTSSVSVPEISLEERFADRLNLKLGDTLTFDIQETPVIGRVTSLRRVNWTSFQPNFFVLFQNGSLDDAPKTFLATIPKLPIEKKMNMQKKILQAMPNVSLIDVDRVIQKLVLLIEQMGWALQVMSAFCILVGLTVLLALANDQVRAREWDIGLLKALGASYTNISLCFILQFTIITFFAALSGGVLSIAGAYAMSYILFDGTWYFNWQIPLAVMIFSCTFAPVLVFFGTRRGLKFQAKELLNG